MPSLSSVGVPAALPCCIEVPNHFIPKAQYAIEMLLAGLGIAPQWVDKAGLVEGGLYYGSGTYPHGPQVLCIPLNAGAATFFTKRDGLGVEDVGAIPWDGEDWPIPFGGERGGLPDVIASTFFWLSGWQEYTTAERDEHGRFPYEASLQARLDCVLQPLVDVYRAWLRERLRERGMGTPGIMWNGKPWAVALTHDVDFIEFRKRSRLKSFVQGNMVGAFGRRGDDDPRRFSLKRMRAAEIKRDISATYFFKGGASAKEDVHYRLSTPWLGHYLSELKNGGCEIGLHPSYAAYDHPRLLEEEHVTLERAIEASIQSVRTHYLRWTDPTTPRLMELRRFRFDSTLGFSEHEGFRHATCFPFRVFDIQRNTSLSLCEMPLALMDTTLFSHRGLSTQAATAQIEAVFAAVRRVGGCAVALWHNTLYDELNFRGQADVFERSLDIAEANGAFVGSMEAVGRKYMPNVERDS